MKSESTVVAVVACLERLRDTYSVFRVVFVGFHKAPAATTKLDLV
jgi:hypothetical protein